MKLYLDVLIIENFVVNLALIMLTFKVLKYKYSFKKAGLIAFLGGIYSLCMVVEELVVFKAIYFQLVVAFIMIYIPVEYKNRIVIFKSFLVFMGASFFLSGICLKVILATQEYTIVKGVAIKEFNIKYLIVAIFILFIIFERIKIYIKDKSVLETFIYEVSMEIEGEKIEVNGFFDSGNELREPITSLPCILIEKKELEKVALKRDKMYKIPYRAIGCSGGLYGIKVEEILLKKDEKVWRKVSGIICPCDEKLSKEGHFTSLISRGFM